MKDMPWMKFYPADWRADSGLKLISREARSLWIDMICLMFEAGTGRLEVNGRPMSENELAKMLGDNPRTIRKLLAEIEFAGVSSRDQDGFIISRRIIRDKLRSELDVSNGRMGGNPSLKNNDLDKNEVNPPLKAQKLEARSQSLEVRKIDEISSARGISTDLEMKLREAAGWMNEPAPNLFVTGQIQALIDSGADLEIDVLPTVRALASKAHSRTSWKYFTNAIAQARADRDAASKLKPEAKLNVPNYKSRNTLSDSFAIVNAAIAEAERREIEAGITEHSENVESVPRLRQITT